MLNDLRYALRTMRANPLFTVVAMLSLALGIGANTAIYSFMDAILVRSLPVQNPESLVVLQWHAVKRPAVVRQINGSIYDEPEFGRVSPSFPYRVLLLFSVNARQAGYRDQALNRFFEDLHSRLAAIPGVRNATATSFAMVSQSMNSGGVTIPGYTGNDPGAGFLSVAANFFETM